jgi:anti-sigma factor RsiW
MKPEPLSDNPLSCAEARAAVSACVDGEAAEIERASARRHLQACPQCREFEAMVLHTRRKLRGAPVLEPSRSLRPAARTARRRLPRPVAVAGIAAALALAAVVGAGVSAVREPGKPAPQQAVRIASIDPRDQQSVAHNRKLRALRGAPDTTGQIELLRNRLG